MKKGLRLKDLKESGWYDFAEWMVANRYYPKDLCQTPLTNQIILEYTVHIATKRIINDLTLDLYQNHDEKKSKKSNKILGLSKQIKEK